MLRTFCRLSFALKLALAALILGFVIGFYLGIAPSLTGTGTAGPAIDHHMSLQHLPVQVHRLGPGAGMF